MSAAEARKQLREIWDRHPDEDEEALARRFLAATRKDDLVPLMAELFRTISRNHVRQLEAEALQKLHASPRRRAQVSDFARLLNQPYRIGDGKRRTLGQMTAEEHRVRILLLQGQQQGIQNSIEIHERALALIEQHRVRCLDDIAAKKAA